MSLFNKNLTIVKINGGLGNQMFQHALGRCIELKHNITVKYDISVFETYFRKYELDLFEINPVFASIEEISKLKDYNPKQTKILKNLPRFIRRNFETYRQESEKTIPANILKIKKSVYLDGYWQSEKYFKKIENVIRKEFIFKKPMNQINQELANQINQVNSVSLHVRRGDYIINKPILDICSLEYYQNAINYIINKVENPHFFVFSDDPKWVADNLNTPFRYTLVTNNLEENNYEDMRLMSFCRHNIIANSSFSWWGAWLNNNPDKVVIAPRNWSFSEMYSKNRAPKNWIRLENDWVVNDSLKQDSF